MLFCSLTIRIGQLEPTFFNVLKSGRLSNTDRDTGQDSNKNLFHTLVKDSNLPGQTHPKTRLGCLSQSDAPKTRPSVSLYSKIVYPVLHTALTRSITCITN